MKVNQLKAGVVLSYLSQGLSILIGLLYTPVMLRLLGQSQYGLYQLSASVISYLGLLSLGFGSSYVRYYARYKIQGDTKGIAKLNGMFMTIFIVIGVISALAGSVLIANIETMFRGSLTGGELETARILMIFMVFNLAVSFPGSVFSSYITANEQYVFQRAVTILSNVLNPFLSIPLLLLGCRSIGLVVIQTVLSAACLTANWIFCRKKLGIRFTFRNFEWGFLKELFLFSFWIFLNQVIDQVNWNVDKFILGIVGGTVTVAVYGVAAQLNSLYLNFSVSISNVFAPRVNRIVNETDDNNQLTDLFTRVGRVQFLILMLIVSGLAVFGKYFIQIWAGPDYGEAYRIALLLIVPAVIPWIQNLGIEIQRAKNKHQFRSVVYAAIAVLNICASIPLAKLYGGTGAAIGTAASLLIGNGLIMNLFYHKKIGLDMVYFWKQIAAFLPALILPAAAGFLIVKFIAFHSFFIFLGAAAAYTAVYCASMWFLGMNQSEKELIRAPLRNLAYRRK